MMSDNKGIGRLGDKYYIISKKGGGGFSQVYLVQNISNQKQYAAKILNDGRFYKRELAVNKLIKAHQIPNVVNFIESGEALVKMKGEEEEETQYVYYFIFDFILKEIY